VGVLHLYRSGVQSTARHRSLAVFAAVAGYPGFLVSGADGPVNQVVFTAVNWLFYFGVIEVTFAIKRKFSTRVKPHKQTGS